MSAGPDLGDRPDSIIGGLLHDQFQRCNRTRNHCFAEGHTVNDAATLKGYDRTLHPWIHGRRPHDVAERIRGWLA